VFSLAAVIILALVAPSAMAQKKYKIAFVPKLVGIPYFNAMEEGGKKAAADIDKALRS
jgi:rhamnose transport system substrate-binding protein